MAKAERGFRPLPEARTQKINAQLNLPEYVDEDRIGVNLRGIERIMGIAGVSTLRILGENGETTEYMPTVVGHTSSGTALAGKLGAVRKEASYKQDQSPTSDPCFLHGYNWTNATITLNTSEISQRILQADGSLRSPKDWSKELNQAIKEGLVATGIDQLRAGSEPFGVALAGFFNTINIATLADVGVFTNTKTILVGLIAYEVAWNGHVPLFEWLRGKTQSPIYQHRHGRFRPSFIGGMPQIDRAVVAGMVAKSSRLVKALN